MIRKVKGGHRVYGKSGRNMGTYRSKAKAKARLKQVEMFSHMSKTGVKLRRKR